MVLDVPLPRGGVADTRTSRAVEEALGREGPRVLWIQGPLGCGKSTSVASFLKTQSGFLAAKRLDCFPNLRLEEALYQTSDFLCQIGIPNLSGVLDQRSTLDGKVGVLLEILVRHPVILWWDDVHSLEVGDGESPDDALQSLLSRCCALPEDAQGRILLTSDRPPSPACALPETVDLPPLTRGEAEKIWNNLVSCRGPAAADETTIDGVPSSLWSVPLHLQLLAHPPDLADDSPGLDELVGAAILRLNVDSLALLEVIAAFCRPMSRQALRELSEADDRAVSDEKNGLDGRLLELESYGLIHIQEEPRDMSYCTVHPGIQQRVELRAVKKHLSRWQGLLNSVAMYHLRLGSLTRDVWHHYRARNLFFQAARYTEASQLNKVFLEETLKYGYFDIARKVLSETTDTTTGPSRAVALGNLAMIYKNQGDYERALELYAQARTELENMDDQPNVARILHQIGNALYLKGELELALHSYTESHGISSELGHHVVATATKVQMANVLWALDRKDEALSKYEEALGELEGSPNQTLLSAVKLQLGQAHLHAKRYVEAESCLRDAESEARGCNDRRGLLKSQRANAILARQRHEYEQALQYYDEAAETALRLGDLLEVLACKVNKGDMERDRTMFGNALSCYLEATHTLTTLEKSGTLPTKQLAELTATVSGKMHCLAEQMGPEAYRRALAATQDEGDVD